MTLRRELWPGTSLLVALVTIVALVLGTTPGAQRGHAGLAMFAIALAAIVLGFPSAFVLLGVGMLFGWLAVGETGPGMLDLLAQGALQVMRNDALLAIPLFLFMGYLVERARLAEALFEGLRHALARVPGALAVATLLTCALMAAATGVVGATITALGVLALPVMLRGGYAVSVATGAIAAGGCLGLLIPPSVLLIVYGATAGVPVAQLYAGTLAPGLLLTALYVAYVVVLARRRPPVPIAPIASDAAPPEAPPGRLLAGSLLPLLALVAAVLGTIALGFAAPHEAAAVGVAGALLLVAGQGRLQFTVVKESVVLAARASAMLGWLLVGAAVFSASFAYLGGQELVERWVLGLGLGPVSFLVFSQAVLFLLGGPLAWPEIIVLVLPILLPLLDDFGIDPLYFGILVALNLQTSFLTPPASPAAFQLRGVGPPEALLRRIYRGMLPFVLLQLLAIALLLAWPAIALWLPARLAGGP